MHHLPAYVKQALNRLNTAGFLAFVVGGAVRDVCLGSAPVDFDIATNATPEQTEALFPKTLSFGKKHGTITVVTDVGTIEVTSFRKDGSYHNHRQPESVLFVGDLRSDLSRRDFTINAMAMDVDGNIIDPFDGQSDLTAKMIRTVGDPSLRFSEDALRMFRALRFSAKLGFEIETDTHLAIAQNAHLAKNLSAERVQAELAGILQSDRPEMVEKLFAYGLLDKFLGKENPKISHSLSMIKQLKAEKNLRFIAFLYVTELSEMILEHLRLDRRTVKLTGKVLSLTNETIGAEKVKLKQQLFRFGVEPVTMAVLLEDTFKQTKKQKMLDEILLKQEPYTASHLAVNTTDLMAAAQLSGSAVGKALTALTWHVIAYPEDNTRERLLEIVRELEQQ